MDAAASPGGDGKTWQTPFDTIQGGLADAATKPPGFFPRQIWVRQGVYLPTTPVGAGRMRTISIGAGLIGWEILGGFDGTEMIIEDRADLYSRTLLSGDLGGTPADISDDALHVVTIGTGVTSAASPRVILDGFTIQKGNADNPATGDVDGGGVLAANSHFRLENVTFKKNHAEVAGGGLHVTFSRVEVARCTFTDNRAEERGGGAFLDSLVSNMGENLPTSSSMVNCLFQNNSAGTNNWFPANPNFNGGGAMVLGVNDGTFTSFNNLFYDNSSIGVGGAIQIKNPGGGNSRWGNCTVSLNSVDSLAPLGGISAGIVSPGIYVGGGNQNSSINSCLVWGNSGPPGIPVLSEIGGSTELNGTPPAQAVAITYSDVGSTTLPLVPPPGQGNLNEDPVFISSTLRNFRLQVGSNCIDAGDDLTIARDVLDIDNDNNFVELTPIDLGEGARQLDNNLTADTGNPDGGGDGIVDMGVFETPVDAQ